METGVIQNSTVFQKNPSEPAMASPLLRTGIIQINRLPSHHRMMNISKVKTLQIQQAAYTRLFRTRMAAIKFYMMIPKRKLQKVQKRNVLLIPIRLTAK